MTRLLTSFISLEREGPDSPLSLVRRQKLIIPMKSQFNEVDRVLPVCICSISDVREDGDVSDANGEERSLGEEYSLRYRL